jgi:hypothetical protein
MIENGQTKTLFYDEANIYYMDSGGIVMPNWLLYKLGNFT